MLVDHSRLVVPPKRTGAVVRDRLDQRLEQGLRGALSLVCAPAGFGKTTAVADFVHRSGRAVGWVSARSDLDDPSSLTTYMVAAIERTWPEVAARASRELPDAAAALTTLANDALGRGLVLVIDDLHLVPQGATILTRWLDGAVPPLHLVAITRANPPFPLSRLRARGQLTELRTEDLQFTDPESTAFLEGAMGLDNDAARTLAARARGWAAGLQLAALAHRDGRVDSDIDEYLVDEVIAGLDPDVRKQLQVAAVPNLLTAELLGALTGLADPEGTLRQWERSGLFLLRCSADEWRFHDLFLDALRRALARSLDAPTRARLHERAAHWLAQKSPRDALDHALCAQSWDLAESLLPSALPGHFTSDSDAEYGLLERFPAHLFETRPRLAMMRVWRAFLRGSPADALQGQALSTVQAYPDPDVERDLLITTGSSKLHLGEAREGLDYLERAFDTGHLGPSQTAAMGMHYRAAGRFVVGDTAGARTAYDDMMEAVPSDLMSQGFAIFGRACLELHLGQVDAGIAWLDPVLDSLRSHLDTLPGTMLALPLLRLCAHAVQGELGQALALAARIGPRLLRIEATIGGGCRGELVRTLLLLSPGDRRWHQERVHWLAMMHRRWPPAHQAHARTLETRLALCPRLGRPSEDAARSWLDEPGNRAGTGTVWGHNPLSPLRSSSPWYVRARALLVLDQLSDAGQAIRALAEWSAERGSVLDAVDAHLLNGELALRRGDPAEAHVEAACRLAEPQMLVGPIVEIGGDVTELALEVAEGELASRVAAWTQAQSDGSILTEREAEVLRTVASGRTNREAADLLGVKVSTVKKHLENTYAKLGVERRTQAIDVARQRGLLA